MDINNKEKKIVLLVDDEPSSIDTLARVLQKTYKVLIATSGDDAILLAEDKVNAPDIILLDVNMSVMNGYEVCKILKKNHETTGIPVIFVTSMDGPNFEASGLSLGAVDYITKPFDADIVLLRVKNHLELKAFRDDLAKQVAARTNEVIALNQEIIDTQREIITTLGDVVETRSKETAYHVDRVSHYIYLLACKSGLPLEEAELLKFGGPMHDVGKIGIPESILNKPGLLTPEERQIINTHSQIGYEILNKSKRRILLTAAIIAHQHHERWDGTGYPRQLKGEKIHIYGRIAAIADVFDALATKRSYKEPWPREKIVKEFQEKRGSQFDPVLVDIFLNHFDEFYEILGEYTEKT